MSLKSLTQVIIVLVIITILGGVYFNYFKNYNKISIENNEQIVKNEADENKPKEPKEKEDQNLSDQSDVNLETEIKKENNEKSKLKKDVKQKKPEIDNTVKEIEYLTTDKNGNKYKILATSGRTNSKNNSILDLDNVRGIITSNKRSTVNIVSDFAEYNSSNLKSNFFQNVVIKYEDKEITCDYFDVDMKTNIAIAYNNVVVTDPKSIMKAGKIILNIETKVIDINPDNKNEKVKVTIN